MQFPELSKIIASVIKFIKKNMFCPFLGTLIFFFFSGRRGKFFDK